MHGAQNTSFKMTSNVDARTAVLYRAPRTRRLAWPGNVVARRSILGKHSMSETLSLASERAVQPKPAYFEHLFEALGDPWCALQPLWLPLRALELVAFILWDLPCH